MEKREVTVQTSNYYIIITKLLINSLMLHITPLYTTLN